jgi:hypothetical protein
MTNDAPDRDEPTPPRSRITDCWPTPGPATGEGNTETPPPTGEDDVAEDGMAPIVTNTEDAAPSG